VAAALAFVYVERSSLVMVVFAGPAAKPGSAQHTMRSPSTACPDGAARCQSPGERAPAGPPAGAGF